MHTIRSQCVSHSPPEMIQSSLFSGSEARVKRKPNRAEQGRDLHTLLVWPHRNKQYIYTVTNTFPCTYHLHCHTDTVRCTLLFHCTRFITNSSSTRKRITSQGYSNRTKVYKHITHRPPRYPHVGVSRAALNFKRMLRDELKWHRPSMKRRPSQPDQQPD